jgi:hypothetical protein
VYGGKAWASCNVINRTQMVLISGYYTNASKEVCDLPSIGGFHALNMGQESYEEDGLWARGLSNVTQYRVPNNVAVQIGGGYVDNQSSKVRGDADIETVSAVVRLLLRQSLDG